MLDHPDQQTTQTILNAYTDSIACGWMRRQLPRMFREARLTEVSVACSSSRHAAGLPALLVPTTARLRDEHLLTGEQVND